MGAWILFFNKEFLRAWHYLTSCVIRDMSMNETRQWQNHSPVRAAAFRPRVTGHRLYLSWESSRINAEMGILGQQWGLVLTAGEKPGTGAGQACPDDVLGLTPQFFLCCEIQSYPQNWKCIWGMSWVAWWLESLHLGPGSIVDLFVTLTNPPFFLSFHFPLWKTRGSD